MVTRQSDRDGKLTIGQTRISRSKGRRVWHHIDGQWGGELGSDFIGMRVASLSSFAATVPEPGSLAVWSAICATEGGGRGNNPFPFFSLTVFLRRRRRCGILKSLLGARVLLHGEADQPARGADQVVRLHEVVAGSH